MIKSTLLVFCATAMVATAQTRKTPAKDPSSPLAVGKPIPAGVLMTVDEKPFNLRQAAANQPLVVIFYRGGWCPYCDAHLGELQLIEEDLRLLGYEIVAISPDQPSKIQETLDKGPMTYTVLSDSSMKTARAFGVAFEVKQPTLEQLESYDIDIEAASGQTHHLLPVPSVFLVGTNGVIDFVHTDPNYKVRLDPEEILKAAQAAAK